MCSLSFPLLISEFHSLPTLLGGPGMMTTTDDSKGCHANVDVNSSNNIYSTGTNNGTDIYHNTGSNNEHGSSAINGKTTPRSSSASSSSSSPDQPDPDTIKMFVGQVPRSMDEHQLRVMFEDFGPVFQINVLRDKITGQSKGCCFVTFYSRKSALDAQNALHNIKTLQGMHHPIQMKPADTENRNERKLFVGMVSKKLSENEIRLLFSTYGTIEECTVLRDNNGVSKGCAFVTFSTRQCAIVAIKAMHHSQTMEGCSSPLVVKFADTQKDKEQKKVQQLQSNLWSLAGITSPPPATVIPTPYLTTLPQLPTVNGLSSQNVQTVGGSPSMPALQIPQMTSSGGINLNMLTLQQLLTGQPLTLPNGSTNIRDYINWVVNTTSTGYPSLMTGTPTTTAAPSMAAPTHNTYVLPSCGNNSDQLTSSILSNYPGLNLSGYLPSAVANSGQTLSSQNQVSLAFGLPSTFNASLAHYMSGNPGLQAFASGLQPGHHMTSPTNGYSTRGMGLQSLSSNSLQSIPISSSEAISTNSHSHLTGIPSLLTSTAPSSVSSYQGVIAQPQSAESAAMTAAAMQAAAAASTLSGLKQHEGPDGANLFIYHLPQEFSDADLLQTFQPFGSIVSAKVFIDKITNLSKCFGFVSYDNAVSAMAAIQAMNGFQVGSKRLKVQLKRSRDFGKPY